MMPIPLAWAKDQTLERITQMADFAIDTGVHVWSADLPLRLELWLKRRELDARLDQEEMRRLRGGMERVYQRLNARRKS